MRFKLSLMLFALTAAGVGRAQTMKTVAGLNTVQFGNIGATATPDPTIAVGTLEFCEHVNSVYQCWYKNGPNALQPVNFMGNTSPKADTTIWSQNGDNSGNTPNCPTADSPNAQILHDNVYNRWIMQKRIHSAITAHDYMCLAISNVEDVSQTNPSFNWFAYEFDLDTVIPKNAEGNYYYPDYPQAGLWQTSLSTTPPYPAADDQAMWITYDLQDTNVADNTSGILLCATDLAGLRASTSNPWVNNSHTPACVVAYPLTAYDPRDNWVPANNSDTTPPLSSDGEMFTYMIEPTRDGVTYLTDPLHTQGFEQWTIDWTAATPTPSFVNSWDQPSTETTGDQLACFLATNYYDTVCVPQPSTAQTGIYIDSVGDRMQQHFHYTSNGGQGGIWTSAHAIQINPSQVLNQTEADLRVLQWNTAIPPAIEIAEDHPVIDPNDPNAYVFLPSMARDRVGNLQGIVGLSGAGSNEHPGLDAVYLTAGASTLASYGYIASPSTDGDAEGTNPSNYRWGDWYGAVLDPSDSCTVWVVGEYLPANRTTEPYWYTMIAELPPLSSCASSNQTVALSPSSLGFGYQQVGIPSVAQTITLTNNQSITLNISNISASGDFSQTNNCGASLAAAASCNIQVTFTPTATGTRQGMVAVSDDASNSPQTANLTGTGVVSALTLTPGSLSFLPQVVGTTSTAQNTTVTNSGGSPFTIGSIVSSGDYAQSSTCSGATLQPNGTCVISVTFVPSLTGSIPGEVTVNNSLPNTPSLVGVSGTGVPPILIAPAALAFGTTNVGTTSPPRIVTLTNNSSSGFNLTFSASGNFSAVGSGSKGCGTTLVAASSCTLSVTFTPTALGSIKGGVAVGYNGTFSPQVVSLSGNGAGGANGPLRSSLKTINIPATVVNTTSAAQSVTITNSSSTVVDISSVVASGDYFLATARTPCGGALEPSAKCTVAVRFSPTLPGNISGSITFTDNASVSTQVLPISGIAVLPVTLSPASLTFSPQSVGTTSPAQVVTLTNNQSISLTLQSILTSGEYVVSTAGSNPCALDSIPALGSCTIGIAFSPSATGTINGVLTVAYNAAGSPQEVSLTGTGQ
ncbi:MAG: choice-of-anchor D domain-containing protein [Candidatus Sulfotelmatobacter sp.]